MELVILFKVTKLTHFVNQVRNIIRCNIIENLITGIRECRSN